MQSSAHATAHEESDRLARHLNHNGSNILFGLFKKKTAQDPYLEKVAAILHTTMAPMMPLQNAYNLAAECLSELQGHIAKGVFRPGPYPREMVMAYYCLCSMVRESCSSDDKQMVFKISIMARVLASKFEDQQTFTLLEKGICLFGEQALNEYFPTQSKDDIANLKRKASDIVFEITRANGAPLSRDDAATLIDNVCANIPESDAFKGGEKVLAISALTSVTAYAIDHDDIDGANAYFACVNAAMKKYVEGQMASFSDYQSQALRKIVGEYGPVVEELKEANQRPDASDEQLHLNELIKSMDVGADVLFIIKNDKVIYVNDRSDHLFTVDSDNDKIFDGRIVNIIFSGRQDGRVIEIFVAFDSDDSYSLFTLRSDLNERLNHICTEIYNYFSKNKFDSIFSPGVDYATQYIYTFKLYQKENKYFMINNGNSQAYLIDGGKIKRNDVDEIKREFWGI